MLANNNKKIGEYGELIAREYILKKGYKVLDVNKNFSNYEIDIIASIDKKIIFFEVKTSSEYSKSVPEDYITKQKLRNLKNASFIFSRKNKKPLEMIYFDLLAVIVFNSKKIAKIKHYKNIC